MSWDRGLDRLQQAVWVKAVKGDVAAVDRVKALAELRLRIAGVASRGESVMTEAFDDAVAALGTKAADGALVAAGRRIAERIDAAASAGDAQAETKALYLVPHLMNVLRELGRLRRLATRSGGRPVTSRARKRSSPRYAGAALRGEFRPGLAS